MKLIVLDSNSVPQKQGGSGLVPRITFTKLGSLSINNCAAKLIGLKAGHKVCLAQDEENPNEWYLFESNNGFALRQKNKAGSLTIQHTTLINEFLGSFGFSLSETRTFLLAGQPTIIEKTKYWGILVTRP
jgi:hypothetical protein